MAVELHVAYGIRVIRIQYLDAVVEAGHLERFQDLLLRSDRIHINVSPDLLLGKDEHPQASTGNVFEVLQQQDEAPGLLRRGFFDFGPERWRGTRVQSAG